MLFKIFFIFAQILLDFQDFVVVLHPNYLIWQLLYWFVILHLSS